MTEDVVKQCHAKMYGGADYTHVTEQRYSLTDIQIEILKDLVYKYPPQMFQTVAVDAMVKNTLNVICSRCKSDNVFVKSVQLRSADEATSKIYTCIDCGNTWRVG